MRLLEGGYRLSACPRVPSAWQGSDGVGGRGQVVSLSQRLDLPTVSLLRCGQHRFAEGRGPAGKTQPLGLLTGVVSKSGRAVWQDGKSYLQTCRLPAGSGQGALWNSG